jgi:fatty acid desaturase
MADNQKGKQTMKNPGFKMDQETVMTKEVSVRRAVRCPRRNDGTGFSLLVLVLALLGVIVAGRSQAPIISIFVWPTPLVLVFTATRFIHEGFHCSSPQAYSLHPSGLFASPR